MPTYEGSGDPASIALRLKRVEAILENLQPGDDEPSNREALDRLYDMTMRNGTHTGGDVTADMTDGFFWFWAQSLAETNKKSIVSVTFGNTDILNRVKDVPLYVQLFGSDTAWNFRAPGFVFENADTEGQQAQEAASLAGRVWGTRYVFSDMADREKSVVGTIGSPSELTSLYDGHGSVLRAIWGLFPSEQERSQSVVDMIRDLRDEIDDLRSRVAYLEAH
jgi:hypothetical protein